VGWCDLVEERVPMLYLTRSEAVYGPWEVKDWVSFDFEDHIVAPTTVGKFRCDSSLRNAG